MALEEAQPELSEKLCVDLRNFRLEKAGERKCNMTKYDTEPKKFLLNAQSYVEFEFLSCLITNNVFKFYYLYMETCYGWFTCVVFFFFSMQF